MAHLLKLNASNLRIMAHYERNLQDGVKERKNLEIDATRTAQNYDLISGATGETAVIGDLAKRLEARLSELTIQKRRANTVLAATWIVTLPAELKGAPQEKQREFFQHTVDFMKNRYGAANVVGAWVHNDETTPHIHMTFTPEERVRQHETVDGKKKDVTDYNAFQGTGKLHAYSTINRTELSMFQRDLQQHLEQRMGMRLSILNAATRARGKNASIPELKAETALAEEKAQEAAKGVQAAAAKWSALGERIGELSERVAHEARSGWGVFQKGREEKKEALQAIAADVRGMAQEFSEAAKLVPSWAKSGPALMEAASTLAAPARKEANNMRAFLREQGERERKRWNARHAELARQEAAFDALVEERAEEKLQARRDEVAALDKRRENAAVAAHLAENRLERVEEERAEKEKQLGQVIEKLKEAQPLMLRAKETLKQRQEEAERLQKANKPRRAATGRPSLMREVLRPRGDSRGHQGAA